MKIKDRIFLGIVAGLIGAIPGRILNKVEFALGLTDSRYEEMAALLFMNRKYIEKTQGKTVGKIANGLLTTAVGISTTYTMSATGRDYALIKGVGISSLAWLGIYGLSSQARMQKSRKPGAALLSYLDHVVFGMTTAAVVTKLGDDAIFPDINGQQKEVTKESQISWNKPQTIVGSEERQYNNFIH